MKGPDDWRDMTFVNRGHLGGYAKSDSIDWPHGDPMTHTPALWDWLIEEYRPRVVWDIGCGEGHAVAHFLSRGLEAWGCDGCVEVLDSAAVARERIIIHDFTRGPLPQSAIPEPPDLAYSCEFVEHVGEEHMESYLVAFDSARVVCFTHAFEGQVGHHHVNCRAPDYWISTMTRRGFAWDEKASITSREIVGRSHWQRSGLIFVRPSGD